MFCKWTSDSISKNTPGIYATQIHCGGLNVHMTHLKQVLKSIEYKNDSQETHHIWNRMNDIIYYIYSLRLRVEFISIKTPRL